MIVFHNVTYRHPRDEVPVLDGISVTIPAGQWVSVIGPNGCGKTTFLKLIGGLLAPSGGNITIAGTMLTRETVHDLRRKIGIVFQNPENQFIGQTVADDIVFGLENRALSRETMRARLAEYAEKLRIGDLLHRHPHTLSGGQMQRASLAAALAMEPEVLLLDEITSMLDDEGRRSILRLIRQLKTEHKYTIVAVTHEVDEMLASDRVIALSDGCIVADGPPKTVLADEALCGKLSLRLPMARRLALALHARGYDVGQVWDEKELMNKLW